MNKKHLIFVINPKAGIDREKSIQKHIEEHIDKSLYAVSIQHTEKPKHGIEIAQQAAADNAFAVIAIGGDGSVNDIAKGLLNTNTALGIVPKGSGNGVARTLQIPLNEPDAIKIINRGNVQLMDVGMANDRLFTSNVGVGFDALIAREFSNNKTRGLVGYTAEVIKNLISYKEKNWKITIDGKEIDREAFMVVVANCREFGYNFQIAPMAKWDDNLLEVIIVKKFPMIMGTSVIYKAMTGKITDNRYVEHFTGNSVIISSNDLNCMQTDGDYYPVNLGNPLKINLLHKSLRVLV